MNLLLENDQVLSKTHAMLLYEEGKFMLVDTGSSNGTFVNNIRLSKAGAESEMTEVFSGDILRWILSDNDIQLFLFWMQYGETKMKASFQKT